MRFLYRCIAVVGCGILLPIAACAFEVAYGPFFTVQGVEIRQGMAVLPLTRGKYANARVLDRETFNWLNRCKDKRCVQTDRGAQTEILVLRAADSRENMWIAEVAVDQRWALTFLIFEHESGYRVVVPESIKVNRKDWFKSLEVQLAQAVDQFKAEGKNAM